MKRHASKPPTQRQLRVAEELRHILAGLFLRHTQLALAWRFDAVMLRLVIARRVASHAATGFMQAPARIRSIPPCRLRADPGSRRS